MLTSHQEAQTQTWRREADRRMAAGCSPDAFSPPVVERLHDMGDNPQTDVTRHTSVRTRRTRREAQVTTALGTSCVTGQDCDTGLSSGSWVLSGRVDRWFRTAFAWRPVSRHF